MSQLKGCKVLVPYQILLLAFRMPIGCSHYHMIHVAARDMLLHQHPHRISHLQMTVMLLLTGLQHLQESIIRPRPTAFPLCCLQAAARAADRRARDSVWCPCDHGTDIGYNSDDDVIILEGSQQSGQTPSTSQAQSSSNARGTGTVRQPAGVALKQHPNSAVANQRHSGSTQRAAVPVTGIGQPRAVPGPPRLPSTAATIETQEQERMTQQQQQVRQHEQTARADHTCKAGNSTPATQTVGGSELVDLTADEADLLNSQEPVPKRVRLHQSADLTAEQHQPNCASSWQRRTQDPQGAPLPQRKTAEHWACSRCTLLNPNLSLQCTACGQNRPAAFQLSQPEHTGNAVSGHHTHLPTSHPAEGAMHMGNSWSCRFCSMLNAATLTHCSACDQWRYGSGAPHASRPTV